MSAAYAIQPDRPAHDRSGNCTAARLQASPPTDEALMRRCADRDVAAFRELVRRYQGTVHGYLTRLIGSECEAEDAAVDVFVRLWTHAPRFEHGCGVATWLYRIATNRARDLHRMRTVRPVEVALDSVAGIAARQEEPICAVIEADERRRRVDALSRALMRLGDADRRLIVLYYIEDLTYPEIADAAGVARAALKSRLCRARRRLRAIMESDGSDSADDTTRSANSGAGRASANCALAASATTGGAIA